MLINILVKFENLKFRCWFCRESEFAVGCWRAVITGWHYSTACDKEYNLVWCGV